MKIKIVKDSHNNKASPLRNNSHINYSNQVKNERNIISGNKSESIQNSSFKIIESPPKLVKGKENFEKNIIPKNKNFERFSISPEIKRKKNDCLEIGEFKLDFKSIYLCLINK